MSDINIIAVVRVGLCAVLLAGASCGCGGSGHTAPEIGSAEKEYRIGIKDFDAGRYGPASEHFTQAIDIGSLNPDLYVDACIHRALAEMELQDFAAALADLDAIERDAPALDQVYLARARVYLKQGDRERATEAFQRAKQENPDIEKPEGL